MTTVINPISKKLKLLFMIKPTKSIQEYIYIIPELESPRKTSLSAGQQIFTTRNNNLIEEEEIFSEFLEESFKDINDFENKLFDLGEESQKLLLIQSLFRDIHTLKGNVGCFNFPNLENFLHKSENIFNNLQKKLSPN
jgi:HPt (histidine-containing phosphotransfer) domain-containing protein